MSIRIPSFTQSHWGGQGTLPRGPHNSMQFSPGHLFVPTGLKFPSPLRHIQWPDLEKALLSPQTSRPKPSGNKHDIRQTEQTEITQQKLLILTCHWNHSPQNQATKSTGWLPTKLKNDIWPTDFWHKRWNIQYITKYHPSYQENQENHNLNKKRQPTNTNSAVNQKVGLSD